MQVDSHEQKILDQFYGNKKVRPHHFDSDPLKLISRALNPVADQRIGSAGLEFIFCMLHTEVNEAHWTVVRDVFETLYFDDLMVLVVCCMNEVGDSHQNLCRVLKILRSVFLSHTIDEVKNLLGLHSAHLELLFTRLNQNQVSKSTSKEICLYLHLVIELTADDRGLLFQLLSKDEVNRYLDSVSPEAPSYTLEELARVELWRLVNRLKEREADRDDELK